MLKLSFIYLFICLFIYLFAQRTWALEQTTQNTQCEPDSKASNTATHTHSCPEFISYFRTMLRRARGYATVYRL